MEDFRGKEREKEEVYSKAVKAGKRTYFMDVKETKSGERYLTITESKRLFDENLNKFVYDKHKIFLYKEDFDNFVEGLQTVIHFIQTGEVPVEDTLSGESLGTSGFSAQDDMEFENLGK
ncbi:PUR family DNA/RNA-binding protein [bacterium]|nr:PUR family DNA/RNA-binding protein [bacterium]